MCGIVGIWNRSGAPDAARAELEEAVRRLHHRGPDDQGVWSNASGVSFGHTRLSIIDLSPLGRQPMKSADGRLVVTFNGEIYNHAAIRARLEAAGHSFRGDSDTEVILHAYEEWGSEAVQQFIGMFAIAIWDEREQTLELVRDRVGVKPLYYGWHDDTLCFASELRALRAFSHWHPTVNREALGEFLQYGCIADDRSIYQGVHKLLPGHRLRLQRGQHPRTERYWSVLDGLCAPPPGSDRDIEAELEALLIDAARHRMVSDVPVGVYLSGGIDSSLVTAILARHHDQTIRTFTIGFREDSHDESQWARRVSQHCGTVHHEYILEASEAVDIARRWGSLFDEPFGDSSGIPTLMVSRLAAHEVKVVLSADGGDELFGGYTVYAAVLDRLERLRRMPAAVQRAAAAALSQSARLGRGTGGIRARRSGRLKAMFLDPTIGRLYDLAVSCLTPQEVAELIGAYESPRPSADTMPGSGAERIALWDFHHYLPGDILVKVDRMTMAASIEGREPLLDHRLVEYAFRLPQHLKRGELGTKHILRSIAYRYLPGEILERRKQGFAIPLDRWLRHELKELVMDYLSEPRVRAAGVFDWQAVEQLKADFYAGNRRLTHPLWFLLAFEMWRESWS